MATKFYTESNVTGNNFIKFIKENRLEDVSVCWWTEGITFSVFLDEAHSDEIEYFFTNEGEIKITHQIWNEIDGDCDVDEEAISTEESLRLRGLG